MTEANTLFSIHDLTHEDGSISAVLLIDQHHNILKGHFPGHPVIPGACMLQVVKEVLEHALNQPTRLKKADSLKFLSMIDPEITTEVQLHMSYRNNEDGSIIVNAKLSSSRSLHFKFQGSFVIEK
jgi:3-hydroxyacyl-[acyl-carrier-protein] dehydratase